MRGFWLVFFVCLNGVASPFSEYSNALRFSNSRKDPNSEYGGGVSYCHGTAVAQKQVGENQCKYAIVTAAHCFESPVKNAILPIEVTYLEITDYFASADTKNLVIQQHPDWKEKKTDIAVFSLTIDCEENIPVTPVRTAPPGEMETCAIASDHTGRFKTEQKNGKFKYVSSPKEDVRVEGYLSLAPRSPTFHYFDTLDESEGYLVPGDSGSGMVCDEGDGKVALTGVLVMAPHVGRRYGVEAGAALDWARGEADRQLLDSTK